MIISVCMITWNEEKLLPIAVESTKGLADEIVVADTGSADNTVQVARDLGCIVIEGEDRYHKAQSRNAAINKASGDWIVILDCDEQIQEPVKLRKFLERCKDDAAYIRLAFKSGDKTTLEFSQMRIWRKGTYLYKYRAHEIPMPQIDNPKIIWTDFVWEHRPPTERGEWKLTYTLDRLLLDVEENPDSSRSKFYLARQYVYMKRWQESIDAFREYLKQPDHDEGDAYLYMAKSYGELGKEKEQIQALHLACALKPTRRDWWGLLAEIYYNRKQFEIATAYLMAALEMPIPKTDYLADKWYGSHIYDLLARSLYYSGYPERGREYAVKALSLSPNDERLQKNLLWFDAKSGNQDAIYQLYGPDVHAKQPRHKELAKHICGKRVLDFGCGTGDLLLLLQGNGRKLYGVDTSEVALQMARARGVSAELFHNWPIGKFDTIVCSQVLEHLDNPHDWILEAKSHLSKNGIVLVTVPSGNKVPSPDHKTIFYEQDLIGLLSELGTVEIIEWSDPYRIFAKVTHG